MRELIGEMPWQVMLALIAVAGLAGYAVDCWWREWKPCWCCKGSAKHYRDDGKVFRDCWVCRRSPGRKLRIGRRVWNRFAKVRKAAS
ncbi:hypothetical protein [Micromonospora sp. NPDC023633]|uniref:hypothetical protein n=1 Tax=Micromonospora sp. NPDC023633 TaxID=3154320 RepID=UPI00340A801D